MASAKPIKADLVMEAETDRQFFHHMSKIMLCDFDIISYI